ncbi:unnamed protein product [Didymodactylos carnosus]|uniref:C2H2-type domain-containing protein n=1 Tax=Didymodactylos carnosus TaxID=1234261 RepID=A0A813QN82_9BILA|nr:unnamed protein product [Didymodactylos carnosus]CAF0783882.1 unnamed protein product [Didymodactylos carnosus]CAF3551223.1 unnamed protein product [Didymodactylos carnosus]CAF3565810.1 unnamed protein product [Didymodactylos carnosus]
MHFLKRELLLSIDRACRVMLYMKQGNTYGYQNVNNSNLKTNGLSGNQLSSQIIKNEQQQQQQQRKSQKAMKHTFDRKTSNTNNNTNNNDRIGGSTIYHVENDFSSLNNRQKAEPTIPSQYAGNSISSRQPKAMKFTTKNNLNNTSSRYATSSDQPQTYVEQKIKNVIKSTKEITHELDLVCQDEPLTEAQLHCYPTRAYDPKAPLPLPAVRKRTSLVKELQVQDLEELDDPDEDFVPSESSDDDESYEPYQERRINRGGRGGRRGRGGGGGRFLFSATTHFVRPQPSRFDNNPLSRSQLFTSSLRYSSTGRRGKGGNDSLEMELERSYALALPRYYGVKNGQGNDPTDYGDFRVKCSVCDEQFPNNITLTSHMCSHLEDINYLCPFDKTMLQCQVCHEEFSTPFKLYMHEDQMHMLQIREFRCRICDQQHHTLIDLFAHLNFIHAGLEMPYYCELCGYRTSMYDDMIHHIRETHKNTRYFFCSYCLKTIPLPAMQFSNLLNGGGAFRHLLLHFNRIEGNKTKESKFRHCRRCILHVKSIKEHLTRDHTAIAENNSNNTNNNQFLLPRTTPLYSVDSYDDIRNTNTSYNRSFGSSMKNEVDERSQVPMATIRRRTNHIASPLPRISPNTSSYDTKSYSNEFSRKQYSSSTSIQDSKLSTIKADVICFDCPSGTAEQRHTRNGYRCRLCFFSTQCPTGYAKHLTSVHASVPLTDQAVRKTALSCLMNCVCGYSTSNGDLMAKHLDECLAARCTCRYF